MCASVFVCNKKYACRVNRCVRVCVHVLSVPI